MLQINLIIQYFNIMRLAAALNLKATVKLVMNLMHYTRPLKQPLKQLIVSCQAGNDKSGLHISY